MSEENSSIISHLSTQRTEAAQGQESVRPSRQHLFQFKGEKWAVWRCMGLRGAGFPAARVLDLAAPECAALADKLLAAEAETEGAESAALKSVNQALDMLSAETNGDCEQERATLIKALRLLKKGKIPKSAGLPAGVAGWIDALASASAKLVQLNAEYEQSFAAATRSISDAIVRVARTNDFCEAVIWQNRQAYHTGIAALLREPKASASRGTKQRQHEELVASYLQRYCLKNDTIGFFGPVGWARIKDEAEAVVERPGPGLLAERNLYFEAWGIDALAGTLSKDSAIRPWIVPRRMPFIHQEGLTLYGSFQGTVKLSEEQALVFRACDGERTARELAMDLMSSHGSRFRSEQEIYSLLEVLRYRALITWAFEVPMELHPEDTLRGMIERVGDERRRARALAALAELEKARLDVRRAVGDAEKLDRTIESLETTFKRLTGANSTRSAGRTYAARTLVYEDCRRDIEVDFGPAVLDSLGPPLSLLLTSARWFTHRAALVYGKAFREIYAEQARRTGSRVINFIHFWPFMRPLFYADTKCLIGQVLQDFQERWSNILNVPYGERRVDYSVEELRPRVMAAFDAPGPGWKFARYHSPDIMIAAPSAGAICAGDYQLVCGELHVASNTLSWHLFIQQHPSPSELFQSLEADFPEPRLVPVVAKSQRLESSRLVPGLISPKDFRLVLAAEPCNFPKSQAVLIAELVIEEEDGELVVRTEDGRLRMRLLDTIADVFMSVVLSLFKMFPARDHTPRISFDRLVVNRESWHYSAEEIPFAFEMNETARFAAARRWASKHGIPRFIFVKTAVEKKPFYVDFESPIYISIFAKSIRRTAKAEVGGRPIAITEMLPGPDQCWLSDAHGQHYTSELRMVCLDLQA